jgi:hypothetical protein
VLSYGADPSGSTDSTNSIQAAINAAGERQAVFFPPGTYSFGALTVTASLQGMGMNTVLKPTAILLITADDVHISNMRFISLVPPSLIAPGNSTIIQTTNIKLYNVAIQNVEFYWDASIVTHWKLAIDSSFTDGLKIANCRFYKGGVQVTRGFNLDISSNYFDLEWDNWNEPIHVSSFSRGVISDNTILNTLTDAIDLFSSGDYCVVSHNRIDGIGKAGEVNFADGAISLKVIIRDGYVNSSGPSLGWVERTVLVNNVIKNYNPASDVNRWYGFYLRYEDLRTVIPPFDFLDTGRNVVISNNVVDGWWTTNPGGYAIAAFAGIHFCGYGGVFSNNVFSNISNQGDVGTASETCGIEVSFYLDPTDATTESSVFEGNSYSGDGTGIIIYGANNCVFSDNTVGPDRYNNRNPRYGIIVKGAVNRCQFANNNFNLTAANAQAFITLTVGSHVGELIDCVIKGNIGRYLWFIGRGHQNTFTANVFGHVLLGIDGTEQSGFTFQGNVFHPTNTALNGITLMSISGINIQGNQFYECQNAVLVDGSASTLRAHDSIFTGNISLGEISGIFVSYANVSVASKATHIVHSNLANHLLTVGNGTMKLGGQVNIGTELIVGGPITAAAASSIGWPGRALITSPADVNGSITLYDSTGTTFNSIKFGGASSAEPSIRRAGTAIELRLADESARTKLLLSTLSYLLASVPVFANNAAALTGLLAVGDTYRTGGDPDTLCIVH